MRSNESSGPPPEYRQALEAYLAGRLRDAMSACLARLQAAAQPDAATVALLAHVLLDSGHVVDAAREFARAASLDGRNADVWLGLAQCELAMSDRAAALRSIDKALSISPLRADVHALSAGLALRAGDGAGAVALARRATALAPGLASAWFNLALALQDQSRGDDAVHAARKAVALSPDDLRAAGLAAELEAAVGDVASARATLDRALAKHPRSIALWTVKGWVASRARDLAGEIDAHAHVLAIEPGNAAALSQLVFAKKSALDWDGLAELQQRFRGGVAAKVPGLTPFSFLSDSSTRGEQRLCAATWSEGFVARAGGPSAPPAPAARDGRRLRIGYLSGDFYQHPTAVLLAGVLEAHDRGRVEVFAYSTGPDDGSAMRARVVAGVEHFVEIDPRRDVDSAARIRANALDVLFDLKGYTEGAATAVLARRPAPVQAHWIGYPGTLAAPFVDYLLADRIVVPDEHASSYAEALVRLPHCYQPNDRSRVASAAPSRDALGLAGDAVVLASLVAPWKLNGPVFDAWARILAAAPDTLLWLLARNGADPAIERARRAFAARGVLPERIVFATHRAPCDYLALYAQADLALDTWPYGAHTTAADALWMGCPLVTWPGESFASRVAASVVTAAGAPELVAGDLEGYVERATALARDASRRAALRERLLHARATSPLYDAAAMARAIESACETMAAQAAAGVRRAFDVSA